MDKYKELIELLRKTAEVKRSLEKEGTFEVLMQAADAIEELLKVQDQMGDDIAMMNEELLNAEKEAQRVESVGNALIRKSDAIDALAYFDEVSPTGKTAQQVDKDINVPTNDIISRRAALDAMCDACGTVQAICAHYPCGRYIAVEGTPSEHPEHEWTPVSKGLPKEHGEYNVTIRESRGVKTPYEFVTTLRYGIADTGENDVFYIEDMARGDTVVDGVIAWKPLPEPYGGEE